MVVLVFMEWFLVNLSIFLYSNKHNDYNKCINYLKFKPKTDVIAVQLPLLKTRLDVWPFFKVKPQKILFKKDRL